MEMKSEEMKNILVLLDTDKHPTPFDMLAAYDAGFDAVIPYADVGPEDVPRIVNDAMFPRGPKGAGHTKIFIGGSDVPRSDANFEAAKKTIFPPFELVIIVDPAGGHTTASALVAKIEETLSAKGLGTLEGKRVAVLAGTGQVGQLAAKICLNCGANVTITSRKKEKADDIAKNIAEDSGVGAERVGGAKGADPDEVFETAKDADVIIATGKRGVMLLPTDKLEKLEKGKVVADVNAVPPLGIEGLDVKDDKKEIIPGIYGIGALAVGPVKSEVEKILLREAIERKKGIFDYSIAFEKARELLGLK
jgi:methylene-tetrahydromethanopterin dehydrogenase